MKIYFISPVGRKSDRLYDTFEETFKAEGHEIVRNSLDADIVFYDLWCGWGEYNPVTISEVIRKKLPIIVFDFFDFNDNVAWHGFTNFQNVKHESWALNLLLFLDAGLVKAYFMRKMNKNMKYPAYVYPIEETQFKDHDFPPVSEDELFNRPNDVCFIGAESKERRAVIDELLKHPQIKVDYHFTKERIPHDEWLNRHRQAKFFLSADGGGFSDERSYQLITTSAFLRQTNNHYQLHPFKNGISCMDIEPSFAEVDIPNLKSILTDKGWLYNLYLSGIQHMKNYYSQGYRAKYILNILKENNIQ